jgi:hypothetical protein
MKRLFATLTTSLFLMLAPMPAGAITGDKWTPTTQSPFVGLLAFYDQQGEYSHRCTGTLLSPTVVLTAAHRTSGTALVYAYFEVTVPDDFREDPTGIRGTPFTPSRLRRRYVGERRGGRDPRPAGEAPRVSDDRRRKGP